MAAQRWLVFEAGKWRDAPTAAAPPCTRFGDLWRYHSNLIDYARVALCLLAALTLALQWPLPTAVLIIVSTLLDWVDGPVARAHDQCTIFGSGVDWLADMLAQVVTLVWWASLSPAALPFLFVATAIELANCIFDFATTATGRYPVLDRQGGFGIILDWSMPSGVYTRFGTALWLAYPLFAMAWCLDLSWPHRSEATSALFRGTEILLAVPALLYVWCELAYLRFILHNWREAPRHTPPSTYDDGPRGLQCFEPLTGDERALLRNAWEKTLQKIGPEWQASLERRAVFWVSLWQHSGDGKKLEIDGVADLDRWARQFVARHYDSAEIDLDGYGLIANPIGSSAQRWHVDYTMDYSTIFISLTDVSAENALQYAVVPPDLPAAAHARARTDLDAVDVDGLVRDAAWVSVRQLLVKPYTPIRMDFGTIHRAVANTGSYDRVLFWISVRKNGAVLEPEPLIHAIPEYTSAAHEH
jgi:phosphatidylglycerophosphate synthase